MKKTIILNIGVFLFPLLGLSKVLVIDPGHDYEDVVSGYRTDTEVNTNWAVANKLKNIVASDYYLDWDVVLTREENINDGQTKTRSVRATLANMYEDLYPGEVYFLSIHCNADDEHHQGYGTESFYCNCTFNNNNQLLTRYANNINNYIIEYGKMHDRLRCVEDYSYYGYHLGVLYSLRMPNCLNEIGFVDDHGDAVKLLDDSYRDRFALAYLDAFKATFSDIEIIQYSFENLPYFPGNQYFMKINIWVKNVQDHVFSGSVKATLRHFPYFELDEINSDFCQLGNDQYISLNPGAQTMLSFSANIPYTEEVGMALCLDAKESGTYQWENVPMPSHKRIIKVPIRGALIEGVVYDSSYNPFEGAIIWTYEMPTTKSSYLYSDIFDPTTEVTGTDGRYEILARSDWNEAVVSVRNNYNYSEILVSPIENRSLTHYYTASPAIIGIGSGSLSNCNVTGLSPDEPRECAAPLEKFDYLGINGHPEIAFVRQGEQMQFEAFPLPLNYTKDEYMSCGGLHHMIIYMSATRCYIPFYKYWDNYSSILNKFDFSICEINELGQQVGNIESITIGRVENSILYIEDIDINSILQGMNFSLVDGKRYKMKLAYDNYYDPTVKQKEVILNVYSTDLILEDPNIRGTNYNAQNITLRNTCVSSELVLSAFNSIKILPETSINGVFRAGVLHY